MTEKPLTKSKNYILKTNIRFLVFFFSKNVINMKLLKNYNSYIRLKKKCSEEQILVGVKH